MPSNLIIGDDDMKIIEIELTEKLIAVLEKIRRDMIQSCNFGLASVSLKKDEIGIKYWNEQIEDTKQMGYNELHDILIEAQYRKIID